ncbi:MAG: SUMF1/EgtB/PvdO family nonheme iron enzyme [Verrucomicrobiales bacterium]|nr:SUMF1/EgtB/PvdO family nonheme iron enzyme [Verrucomicrobiales bacterium]
MRVFISYRRADLNGNAEALVGRICDHLSGLYGEKNVFMDVSSIPFGENFSNVLKSRVAQSDVLLAVIGPEWSGLFEKYSSGIDYVEMELLTAMENGVSIIPVMIGGTSMPDSKELPESVAAVSQLNSLPLDSGQDFRLHFNRLKDAIEKKHLIENADDGENEHGAHVKVLKGQEKPRKRGKARSNKAGDQPDLSVVVGSVTDPTTHKDTDVAIEFVHIPPGEFTMGSDQSWASHNEMPRHVVSISEDYWISRYLLTLDQKKMISGQIAVRGSGDNGNSPAVFDDWEAVEIFCRTMNDRFAGLLPGGYHFYPPTEAQWEKACRDGYNKDVRFYPSKSILGTKVSRPKSLIGYNLSVGLTRPNTLGLHDLLSLNREWCSDVFSDDFYIENQKDENSRVDPEVTFDPAGYSGYFGANWSDHMIGHSVRGIPAKGNELRLTARGAGPNVASDKLRRMDGTPDAVLLGYSFKRRELEIVKEEWWHPAGLRLAIRKTS